MSFCLKYSIPSGWLHTRTGRASFIFFLKSGYVLKLITLICSCNPFIAIITFVTHVYPHFLNFNSFLSWIFFICIKWKHLFGLIVPTSWIYKNNIMLVFPVFPANVLFMCKSGIPERPLLSARVWGTVCICGFIPEGVSFSAHSNTTGAQ